VPLYTWTHPLTGELITDRLEIFHFDVENFLPRYWHKPSFYRALKEATAQHLLTQFPHAAYAATGAIFETSINTVTYMPNVAGLQPVHIDLNRLPNWRDMRYLLIPDETQNFIITTSYSFTPM
jgi:hypothetical protein